MENKNKPERLPLVDWELVRKSYGDMVDCQKFREILCLCLGAAVGMHTQSHNDKGPDLIRTLRECGFYEEEINDLIKQAIDNALAIWNSGDCL